MLDGAGGLNIAKQAGVLANLDGHLESGSVALAGRAGIGHTRWATHSGPTDRNAPPRADGSEKVAVVHNGIIENFAALRADLEVGRDPDAQRHRHRGWWRIC